MFRTFTRPAVVAMLAVVLAGLALAPATALAEDKKSDGPDFGAAAGPLSGLYAPSKSHATAYTSFVGTKNQISSADLDTWKGIFAFQGEFSFKMIGIPLSIVAEIGYQYQQSGTGTTGWTDAFVAAKLETFSIGPALFAAWVGGNLPIGTSSVTLDAYEATAVGLSLTIMPIEFFFLNGTVDMGAIWKITGADKTEFEFKFRGEGGLRVPLLPVSGRLGLTGLVRTDGFDTTQFSLYLEANVFMFFVHVSVPIDIEQGFEGVKTAFDTGQLVIHAGVSFAW